MKLTTGILLTTMVMAGAAWGQDPNVIQSAKDKVNGAEQQKVAKENEALDGSQPQHQASPKPGTKPSPAGAKAAAKHASPATASTKPLIRVKPPQPAVTAAQPGAPTTKAAAAASKPAVPATRMVVVPTKPAAPETKSTTAAKPAASADKKDNKTAQMAPSKPAPTKIAVLPVATQPKQGAQKTTSAAKKAAAKPATPFAPHKAAKETPKPAASGETASKESTVNEAPKAKKIITAEGRRDPFVSPVVSRASGPGCSVGKRCLAIDQILVRGVVRSETGMIAVVVNSINKAYFLKENDPVFNGYVLRITGDSVVFKETYQDRLGKELTREVVKKITTPAV